MDIHYATDTEPATPDYVLSVIRESHRQDFAQYATVDDEREDLSFDTTVSEWRDAWELDLLTLTELGRHLNAWWGIDCTRDQWHRVRKPAGEKRLLDVCELIANRAVRHKIRPARLLGRTCVEAGAFLTIRSLLADAGADASCIVPSAPLTPFTRKYSTTFLGPIARLASGNLPPVKFFHPVYDVSCWLMFAGPLFLIVGWVTGWPYATIAGVGLIAFSFVMSSFTARCILPRTVEFGSLRTFRDLAKTIAAPDVK